MPRGRPKKVRDKNDDGKAHYIWEFTDNPLYDQDGNRDETRFARFQEWAKDPSCCKKMMMAEETAPTTGKKHGQGRVSFRRAHTFDYVSKLFGHVEVTVCTDDWSYFRKLDSVLLINEDHRQQGRRNVFKEQLEAIKAGANQRECALLEGANYQSNRGAELSLNLFEPERPHAPREVELVHSQELLPAGIYRLNDMRFWNGYDAHESVFINQSVCKLTVPQLKMVCGPAPFRVGRGRQARFTKVYLAALSADERKLLGLEPRPSLFPLR